MYVWVYECTYVYMMYVWYICVFQSTGDPSLLLNYCREYWDGCSITPLTSSDRQEVPRERERERDLPLLPVHSNI